MKVAAVILISAIGLLVASLQMQPFASADGEDWFSNVPQEDSQAYHQARSQALTPKYLLEDYGVTLAFVAAAVALLSRKRGLLAPASSFGFAVVALTAPLLTAAGCTFDLIQGFERREFPPWADSMGIPLAGVPVIAVVLAGWSYAHLAFLSCIKECANVRLSLPVLRGGHKWLLFVAAVTASLVVLGVAEGSYPMAVPGALWLYYYASILAVRRSHGG
jgi:hypothetical protein